MLTFPGEKRIVYPTPGRVALGPDWLGRCEASGGEVFRSRGPPSGLASDAMGSLIRPAVPRCERSTRSVVLLHILSGAWQWRIEDLAAVEIRHAMPHEVARTLSPAPLRRLTLGVAFLSQDPPRYGSFRPRARRRLAPGVTGGPSRPARC